MMHYCFQARYKGRFVYIGKVFTDAATIRAAFRACVIDGNLVTVLSA